MVQTRSQTRALNEKSVENKCDAVVPIITHIYVVGRNPISDYNDYEPIGVFDSLEKARKKGIEYYEDDIGYYWEVKIIKMKINEEYEMKLNNNKDIYPDLFEDKKSKQKSDRRRKKNEREYDGVN